MQSVERDLKKRAPRVGVNKSNKGGEGLFWLSG